MSADHSQTTWRVPKRDDPWLTANAGRMFELLSGVHSNPPGCPVHVVLQRAIQDLFGEAYVNGIDIIAVAENGLSA